MPVFSHEIVGWAMGVVGRSLNLKYNLLEVLVSVLLAMKNSVYCILLYRLTHCTYCPMCKILHFLSLLLFTWNVFNWIGFIRLICINQKGGWIVDMLYHYQVFWKPFLSQYTVVCLQIFAEFLGPQLFNHFINAHADAMWSFFCHSWCFSFVLFCEISVTWW